MIGGMGNVPCSTYSQTQNGKDLQLFVWSTSEARDNPYVGHSWKTENCR